jgi:hypothetical protein
VGTNNLGHAIEKPGKAVRKLIFGRVAVPGTEMMAEMSSGGGI